MKTIKVPYGSNMGREWNYEDILMMRYYWNSCGNTEPIVSSDSIKQIILQDKPYGEMTVDEETITLVRLLEEKVGSAELVGILSDDYVYDLYKSDEGYYGIYSFEGTVEIVGLILEDLNWVYDYWKQDDWENYLTELGVDVKDYQKWLRSI